MNRSVTAGTVLACTVLAVGGCRAGEVTPPPPVTSAPVSTPASAAVVVLTAD